MSMNDTEIHQEACDLTAGIAVDLLENLSEQGKVMPVSINALRAVCMGYLMLYQMHENGTADSPIRSGSEDVFH